MKQPMRPQPLNRWQGKSVLVTGGAGLIGSYVTEMLVDKGAQVTVIDNLSRGRLSNLGDYKQHIRFIKEDLRDVRCTRHFWCQDVVIHLAAPSYGIAHSGQNHSKMFRDTIIMGMNALEAARCQGVERFLLVSSSCVYPDNAPIPTEEVWGTRGTPEEVNQGYGWAKRMLELMAGYYANDYKMNIAIARPFNTYGPRVPVYQDDRDHLLIALAVRALTQPGPLTVWGSGEQSRAFLHARDVAKLLLHVAEARPSGWPINIGSSAPVSVKDLARMIMTAMGRTADELVFDTSKPEGAACKCSSDVKNAFLGLPVELTPLEQGIIELCAYVRSELGIFEPPKESEG